MASVQIKGLTQRSATSVGLWAFIALMLTNALESIDVVGLPNPWDKIVALAITFIVGLLRLLTLQETSPSVSVSSLPPSVQAYRKDGTLL